MSDIFKRLAWQFNACVFGVFAAVNGIAAAIRYETEDAFDGQREGGVMLMLSLTAWIAAQCWRIGESFDRPS